MSFRVIKPYEYLASLDEGGVFPKALCEIWKRRNGCEELEIPALARKIAQRERIHSACHLYQEIGVVLLALGVSVWGLREGYSAASALLFFVGAGSVSFMFGVLGWAVFLQTHLQDDLERFEQVVRKMALCTRTDMEKLSQLTEEQIQELAASTVAAEAMRLKEERRKPDDTTWEGFKRINRQQKQFDERYEFFRSLGLPLRKKEQYFEPEDGLLDGLVVT